MKQAAAASTGAQTEESLSIGVVLTMLVLALIWGTNMAVVKLAAGQLPPIFQAGVRSVVAADCLWVWMVAKGVPVFPSRVVVAHGLVLGFLFGAEFGVLYPGMVFTNVARSYLLCRGHKTSMNKSNQPERPQLWLWGGQDATNRSLDA
ncbi:MAG: DMT family transporter [Deltaproteobacteria bacterium]|nr:DMT family transporter [Deltaproteobacteria bacterium]